MPIEELLRMLGGGGAMPPAMSGIEGGMAMSPELMSFGSQFEQRAGPVMHPGMSEFAANAAALGMGPPAPQPFPDPAAPAAQPGAPMDIRPPAAQAADAQPQNPAAAQAAASPAGQTAENGFASMLKNLKAPQSTARTPTPSSPAAPRPSQAIKTGGLAQLIEALALGSPMAKQPPSPISTTLGR